MEMAHLNGMMAGNTLDNGRMESNMARGCFGPQKIKAEEDCGRMEKELSGLNEYGAHHHLERAFTNIYQYISIISIFIFCLWFYCRKKKNKLIFFLRIIFWNSFFFIFFFIFMEV